MFQSRIASCSFFGLKVKTDPFSETVAVPWFNMNPFSETVAVPWFNIDPFSETAAVPWFTVIWTPAKKHVSQSLLLIQTPAKKPFLSLNYMYCRPLRKHVFF